MDNNTQENKEKGLAIFWLDFLMQEFKNETDRGAVVLTTSLLENALTNLLKNYLVPTPDSDDELFDHTSALLSSFNAKIQITQRLGLISPRLARDLNTIRKMRNEFAHNIHGSTLESGKIKDLLANLTTSSNIIKGYDLAEKNYPPGCRGEFLKIATIILFHLHSTIENIASVQLKPTQDEWIYTWTFSSPSPTIQRKDIPAKPLDQ